MALLRRESSLFPLGLSQFGTSHPVCSLRREERTGLLRHIDDEAAPISLEMFSWESPGRNGKRREEEHPRIIDKPKRRGGERRRFPAPPTRISEKTAIYVRHI